MLIFKEFWLYENEQIKEITDKSPIIKGKDMIEKWPMQWML